MFDISRLAAAFGIGLAIGLLIVAVAKSIKDRPAPSKEIKLQTQYDLNGIQGLEGCTLYKIYTRYGASSWVLNTVLRCKE